MNLAEVFHDVAHRQQRFTQALKSGRLSSRDSHAVRENFAFVYKQNTLGMGHTGAADPEGVDDATGAIPFTISVYEEDRDGDLVVPLGCRLHNYAKNPGVYFGHQQWEIPIGVSRSPSGQITVFPRQDRIQAICYFDRADPDADFIYGKCARGILNAASIAFVPLEAYRREEVEKAQPHGNRPAGMPLGWFFKTYDLTEWSVVGVPSNANAIRDSLDTEKSFLSPRLQKGLSAYAAQAKDCWNGWCPVPPKGTVMKKKHCCHNCERGWACSCKQQKFANQALMEPGGMQGTMNPPPGVRPDTQRGKAGQPSSDIDSSKACKILEDGEVNGHPLTEDQRQMFGAACGRSQKGKKAMATTDGQAGGYLTNSGKVQEDGGSGSRLSENEAPGYASCTTCDGSGNCPHCQGTGYHGHEGQECDECDGTGNCPTCDGMGLAEKTTPKVKGKVMRKAAPPIEDTEDEDEAIPQAHEEGKAVLEDNDYPGAAGEGVPQAYESGKNVSGESLGSVGEVTPPQGTGMKGSESEPFNPKPSAAVVARLYSHNKAALDYLDQELTSMDNPGVKAWLDNHKAHYRKAMEDLGAALVEHHPDYEMDKLCKALESEVPPTPDAGLEGEAGMVASGNTTPERLDPTPPTEGLADAADLGTPPFEGLQEQAPDYGSSAPPEAPFDEQATPEEEGQELYGTPNIEEDDFTYNPEDTGAAPFQGAGKGNLEGDSGMADTDADTEEILERYRHPKSGRMMIRKIGRLRKAANGQTYFVRYNEAQFKVANTPRKKLEHPTTGEFIEGSGDSEELEEGDKPAPYNKQLARDVGGAGEFLADLSGDLAVHKGYRTVAKFHAQRLGYVQKQLTSMGRLQRNNGNGSRALSDKGKIQAQGGGGETLSERGGRQADSRSRQQVVGSGTPDGLSEGTKPAPYNKSRPATRRTPPAAPIKDQALEAALAEFASVKRMFREYGITN